ncbi:MAG: CDP-alcohol phosphatidyltransferase family protein [Candidatus Brocadiia bacterium]
MGLSGLKNIFTIANGLTLARVILLPGFIIAFLYGGKTGYAISMAFALFFELTDAFDGLIARKFSGVTVTGKLLDPLADTLTRFTIFLTFMYAGFAPFWMLIILFFRDMIVAYVRIGAALNNIVMGARFSGKLKAMIQGGGIFIIIAVLLARELRYFDDPDMILSHAACWWTMLIVTTVTAYSLVDYLWALTNMTPSDSAKN